MLRSAAGGAVIGVCRAGQIFIIYLILSIVCPIPSAGFSAKVGALHAPLPLARDAVFRDLLSIEPVTTADAASVITITRSVAGVSSVLGWLRAQPKGRKRLRDGVACFEDIIELRYASDWIELAVTLQRRAVDNSFDQSRQRAITALMRTACCEKPAPSRLPRPAAVVRNTAHNGPTVEWQVDPDELEEIGWALVAKAEQLSWGGIKIRLNYESAEGKVKLFTSACSDHFQPLLDQIVHEAFFVPVIERQPTAGAAWAAAIVDELVRSGVDRFVVCPGSRSTPLALAVKRHPRASQQLVRHDLSPIKISNFVIIMYRAKSRRSQVVIHDERAAAFFALGHGRAHDLSVAAVPTAALMMLRDLPTATNTITFFQVIATSGTAASNLLPAAAEAAEDGIPLILLTADRPPEMRGVGADQAMSSQRSLLQGLGPAATTFTRELGPADDRVAMLGELSEISLGVYTANTRRAPVHFNLAFRENLAPRKGLVRGSSAGVRGFAHANAAHPARTGNWDRACVRNKKFQKWERGFKPIVAEVVASAFQGESSWCRDDALWRRIEGAKFGVIIFGRLVEASQERAAALWLATELLSNWLVVHCDTQSGLRDDLENAYACVRRPGIVFSVPLIRDILIPDVVLQIGASVMMSRGLRAWLDGAFDAGAYKIVAGTSLDNHDTRVDDDGATTHRFRGSICTFSSIISRRLFGIDNKDHGTPRDNTITFLTGPISRVAEAGVRRAVGDSINSTLTEPTIAALTTAACAGSGSRIFASNSMAIRDIDAYGEAVDTAANRGLAGIDGVIASAAGYAANGNNRRPVFLLIGDQAFLHDISSLRVLMDNGIKRVPPLLKLVVVNNRGGAIFSFLPIAENCIDSDFAPEEAVDEVDEFEPLFGAPHSVGFRSIAAAFNLSFASCSTSQSLRRALADDRVTFIEACVGTSRSENVRVHHSIDARVAGDIRAALVGDSSRAGAVSLAWSRRCDNSLPSNKKKKPTLVVLHGLFGTRADFDETLRLGDMHRNRDIISIDLNGHGASGPHGDAGDQAILFSFEAHVEAIFAVLDRAGVVTFDVMGYSMGARIALFMKRIAPQRVRRVIAASANLEGRDSMTESARRDRLSKDEAIAEVVQQLSSKETWLRFFDEIWYAATTKVGMWASLRSKEKVYAELLQQRLSPRLRPRSLAASIRSAGLARSPSLWTAVNDTDVLYIYGDTDARCSAIAKRLANTSAACSLLAVKDAGHALPTEAAAELGNAARAFLNAAGTAAAEDEEIATYDDIVIDAVHIEMFNLPRRAVPATRWVVDTEDCKAGMQSQPWIDQSPPRLRGVLVVLASTTKEKAHRFGLGEASPCYGVHEEPLEAVVDELRRSLLLLRGVKVPKAVSQLDGSLGAWINRTVGGLSPVARFAIETAVLQLVADSSLGALYASALGARCARSRVRLAALVDDSTYSTELSARVVKVKVGSTKPKDDARRINDLVDLPANEGVRIRIDANRAWTPRDYGTFEDALTPAARSAIDFVEEPTITPVLATLPLALDETIYEHFRSRTKKEPKKWSDEWDSAATLVLKPAILGVETTLMVCREAAIRGKPVGGPEHIPSTKRQLWLNSAFRLSSRAASSLGLASATLQRALVRFAFYYTPFLRAAWRRQFDQSSLLFLFDKFSILLSAA